MQPTNIILKMKYTLWYIYFYHFTCDNLVRFLNKYAQQQVTVLGFSFINSRKGALK